jgi:D-alanine--D-alanine ligase
MRTPLKTALIYNLKRIDPLGGDDTDAEFDRQSTIDALAAALEKAGLQVEALEAESTQDFLPRLLQGNFQFAFNISEGRGGRTRESQVPALLEFLKIPYMGSDSTTISVAHDKSLAKRLVRSHGLRTAPFSVLKSAEEPFTETLRAPLFVKPLHEGTSKGIRKNSFCQTEADAREVASKLIKAYHQPVLVEEFLPGRDFTVGLLGNPPRTLPIVEVVYGDQNQAPIYDFDIKIEKRSDYFFDCPAKLEPKLKKQIEALAVDSFRTLSCRDVARVDIRLDHEDKPTFIELNPLPGLTPGFSDLAVAALQAGLDYDQLVKQIVESALQRFSL